MSESGSTDTEIASILLYEFDGPKGAIAYARRIAAVQGPLSAQYARVWALLENNISERAENEAEWNACRQC
jgi:hypothetical protein